MTLLLAAGGDTTDKAISNMWYHMMYTRPDQFSDVKAAPELWTNVFTEMMRYGPVVHAQFRRTSKGIKLYDEIIPERDDVTFYLGAGNRDPDIFKDADIFDVHPTKEEGHEGHGRSRKMH